MTKKIAYRRDAFTLVEMLVVIAIMLALAALAAAFAPRVNDNQKMTRAVDLLEQWLLTAKMRAKRDGLSTGLRFVQAPGDPVGVYSQFQYIQQPQPLAGSPNGASIQSALSWIVTFAKVDFTLGGLPANQYLVQPGDYLEINGGGVYLIGLVPNGFSVQLATSPYSTALHIPLNLTSPITNYRIIRQPRILIGEEPLTLPSNYAVPVSSIVTFNSAFGVPDTLPFKLTCNVATGANGIYPEILFSPTGTVVGTNAGSSTIWISVWDTTMDIPDPNRVGIVGIQSRSGFIGAYGVALSGNPLWFVQTARESGL